MVLNYVDIKREEKSDRIFSRFWIDFIFGIYVYIHFMRWNLCKYGNHKTTRIKSTFAHTQNANLSSGIILMRKMSKCFDIGETKDTDDQLKFKFYSKKRINFYHHSVVDNAKNEFTINIVSKQLILNESLHRRWIFYLNQILLVFDSVLI